MYPPPRAGRGKRCFGKGLRLEPGWGLRPGEWQSKGKVSSPTPLDSEQNRKGRLALATVESPWANTEDRYQCRWGAVVSENNG